jgi:hypothetical protein
MPVTPACPPAARLRPCRVAIPTGLPLPLRLQPHLRVVQLLQQLLAELVHNELRVAAQALAGERVEQPAAGPASHMPSNFVIRKGPPQPRPTAHSPRKTPAPHLKHPRASPADQPTTARFPSPLLTLSQPTSARTLLLRLPAPPRPARLPPCTPRLLPHRKMNRSHRVTRKAYRKMKRSRRMVGSTPGRCTLMATSSPEERSTALYT